MAGSPKTGLSMVIVEAYIYTGHLQGLISSIRSTAEGRNMRVIGAIRRGC